MNIIILKSLFTSLFWYLCSHIHYSNSVIVDDGLQSRSAKIGRSVATFTQFEDTIKYAIKENQPGQMRIGKITEDASLETRKIIRNLSTSVLRFKLQKSLDLFDLNPITSVLRTKVLINLEELCPSKCPTGEVGQLDLVVNVWDNMILKGIIKVEINVQDVNDNVPTFMSTSIFKNVKEVIYGIGKSIELQKAIDRDVSAEHNHVIYDLDVKQYGDTFRLKVTNHSFPTLILKKALDYEKQKIYDLDLWAWNKNANFKKSKLAVTIRVININDMEPKFKQPKYEVSIPENLPINSMIVQVEAIDEDEDSEITYRSADYSSDLFSVSTKGQVVLKKALDYETTTKHIIDVQATDREFVANTKVIISVEDVNDEAPEFNLNPSTCRIEENRPNNIIIGQITITDKDSDKVNGQLTCWEPETLSNKQAVVFKPPLLTTETKGKFDLYTRTTFDREESTDGILRVLVVCHDGARNNRQTSTLTISLTVLDVNDNAPQFQLNSFATSIEENNAINSMVFRVHAVDKDSGMNGIIIYDIDKSHSFNAGSNIFDINKETGEISVNQVLDREKQSFYWMTIIARDNGTSPKQQSASCTLNVTVVDANDHAPVFIGPTELSILENEPLGQLIGHLKATDKDAGLNAEMRFNLLPNHNTHLFQMTSNGTLFSANKFDREITPRYCLQMEISDKGKPPNTVTHSICVEILDQNDNPPRLFFPDHAARYTLINSSISQQKQVISLDLSVHESPDFEIIKAEASDPDEGVNSEFQFRINEPSSNIKGFFNLDPYNGKLKLKKLMSRDNIGERLIQIVVEDNGTPSQKASADILLKIQDIPTLKSRIMNPDVGLSSSKSQKFKIAIIFSAASAILALIFIITVLCIVRPCSGNAGSRTDDNDHSNSGNRNNGRYFMGSEYSSVARQFLCDTKSNNSNLELQNDQYLYSPTFDRDKQSYFPTLYATDHMIESSVMTSPIHNPGPPSYSSAQYNQFSLPRSYPFNTSINETKNSFSPIHENSHFQTLDNGLLPTK